VGSTRSGRNPDTRRGVPRAIIGCVVSVAIALGFVAVAVPAEPAAALSGSQFDPGEIISDSEFYNGSAMSEQQIQSFLDGRIAATKLGACETDQCVNVRTDNVESRARLVSDRTGNVRCEAFQGGPALRASTVIYRAQVACGINAKVILVTLEKEQGLLSKSNPSKAALDRAMGYACPDTAPCAVDSLGFANQVYKGTLQLKTYKASNFGIQPGSRATPWHPNAACGSSVVNIRTYGTAALYNYTPYQPNAAALTNLYGPGDACSSYGNRNFWVFYNTWFGSPTTIRPAGVTVSRVGAADRYGTSVAISAANFDPATQTVYVASGMNYPDALSAAPAAALRDAPLLLVPPTSLPGNVRDEIVRLTPAQIVVVGGTSAISQSVVLELQKIAPVRRDAGQDRFATSRAVAEGAFLPGGADVAYIATGLGFADALSAGAAAGAQNDPVILVDGQSDRLDDATRALITRLGVKKVVIAGGASAVSEGVQDGLATVTGVSQVVRAAGSDRYATSEAINDAAFAAVPTFYVASGTTFPDALAGAALAGARQSPLYLVPATCLRRPMLQQLVDSGAKSMVILGGTTAVANSVASFTNCE